MEPRANMNTTSIIPEKAQVTYDRTLLSRMVPELKFLEFGQKKPLKKNQGKAVNFRRYSALPPATTALKEGVTPPGSKLSVDEVEVTLSQYGDFVEITDVLDLTGIDPVAAETSEILGEQAGLTIDHVVRDIICVGTNVQYAGGGAKATEKISAEEVKKAARTLKKANAKPFEGGYIGIVDPDISFDLQNDPLWQDVSKYNGGQKIMDGEIGKLGGVRFIETTEVLVKTEDGEADPTHCAMIIGKDAYGVVDLEGSANKPSIIIKPFGSSGTEDPLNQRQTQGWKAMFTAARLNELAMVRLEVKVSK